MSPAVSINQLDIYYEAHDVATMKAQQSALQAQWTKG
jgi:hypothetical protein